MDHNFEDDVRINRFQLDTECEVQASRYHYWAELLAEAKARVNRLDNRLKAVMAEAELDLRKTAEMNGAKTTESGIKAQLEVQEEVRAARKSLADAWATQYHLEAGVKALEHRRTELSNLVELYCKAYYSAPEGQRPNADTEAAQGIRKGLNNKE